MLFDVLAVILAVSSYLYFRSILDKQCGITGSYDELRNIYERGINVDVIQFS